MNWFQQIFSRRSRYDELSESIREHLDEKIADLIDNGMTHEQAESTARRAFGNVTRIEERSREEWQLPTLESIWADFRYAFRRIWRAPAYAATVAGTLALGIGVTTAIFSVTHAVLLQPLPYKNPSRLVVVLGGLKKRDVDDLPFSEPDLVDLKNDAKSTFTDFASVSTEPLVVGQSDGKSELVHTATVTPNFFQLLGGKILLGRDFSWQDGQSQVSSKENGSGLTATQAPSTVVILSYNYWQRQYGGSKAVLGHRLSEGPNGGAEIIGVLAPGFQLLFPPRLGIRRSPDIWFARNPVYDNSQRNTMSQWVVGRLKNGTSLQSAQDEVNRVAAELRNEFPIKQSSGFTIQLQSMHGFLVASEKPYILALLGAAVFLLIIACANVANLMLVRMSLRDRELAVRVALGCSRWKLLRQVLAEAITLSGIGTLLGLGLAWLATKWLLILTPPNLPQVNSVAIHPVIVAWAALLALLTAMISGTGPALHASRPSIVGVLRAGRSSAVLGEGRWLRDGAVVIEIALSFALLIGSGLMLRSVVKLRQINPGFQSHGLLTFTILGPEYSAAQQRAAFMQQLGEHLRAVPGVSNATAAYPLPLADSFGPIRWGLGDALSDPSKFQAANYQVVLPGYFRTLRTSLIAGRAFTNGDNDPTRNVVLVDQLLADKAFPHQSALGKRILIRVRTPKPEWVQIIGIVAHQRDSSLAHVGRPQIYFTDGFMGYGFANHWAIRSQENPAALESAVRDAVSQLGEGLVVTQMEPMDFYVNRAQATTRFAFLLIAIFALIAALLAGLGIYGVLATVVRQRTPEIGVRMALGSSRGDVFRLILRRGMVLGVTGVVIGAAISLAIGRFMGTLLVGISATDAHTFFSVAAAFLLIVVFSSWLPAQRAAGIDPIQALRSE